MYFNFFMYKLQNHTVQIPDIFAEIVWRYLKKNHISIPYFTVLYKWKDNLYDLPQRLKSRWGR